jgi:uncharacterized membrane protein
MDNETTQTIRRSSPDQVSTCLAAAALAALLSGCGSAPPADAAVDPSGKAAPGSNLIGVTGPDGGTLVVYLNFSPVISAMGAMETFPTNAEGHLYVKAYLSVSATDQDGDDLDYEWSSPDCPAATITFPHHDDQSHVEFTAGPGTACKVQVKVTDLWKGGAPVGSNLPLEKGGETLGILELSRPPTITVGG